MTDPVQKILRFFVENVPDAGTLALAGPVALAWAAACLLLARLLKKQAHCMATSPSKRRWAKPLGKGYVKSSETRA